MNNVFISNAHGCVYSICEDMDSDGDYLIMTPQYTDGSYDTNHENWVEVDEMALMGEDQDIQLHIEHVWDTLRRERDGIFADPDRM